MKRKTLLLILVFSLAFAILAGCAPADDTPAATAPPATNGNEEVPTPPVLPPDDPDDHVTISLFAMVESEQGAWNDMYLFRKMEEMFNVSFDITEIHSTVWPERVALAFATGDYPDIFLNGLSEEEFMMYGSQGMFIDLSRYINQQNTPNIYRLYQEFPELRRAHMAVDGQQFFFRGYDRTNIREYAQARFFVNKQWMEDFGMDVPTTLDEFTDFLFAVRDSDPNRIPMTGVFDQESHSLLTFPLSAMGFTVQFWNNNVGEMVDVQDGTVVFVPTHDLFLEVLTWMNMLFRENLLDNEYFTQTVDARNAKLAEGRVGAFMDWAHWLRIPDEAIWSQYDGIVPLTSAHNDTPVWPSVSIQSIGIFGITDRAQNIPRILQVLDWTTTFEAYRAKLGGPDLEAGGHPDFPGQGHTIEFFDDPALGINPINLVFHFPEGEFGSAYEWRMNNISPHWGSIPACRVDFTEVEFAPEQRALTDALVNNYADAFRVGWPNTVRFTEDEANTLALIRTDLYTYILHMIARFITGEESLENFDVFRQGIADRGLETYMEIYQRAFDRYMGS